MIRRIALVAPPWYPVPPRGYGGIELVVDLLARELRALGHEVVLFAAEDSAAASHPICVRDWAAYLGGPQERVREVAYGALVLQALRRAEPVDVIHDHCGMGTLLAAAMSQRAPVVHTVHGTIGDAERAFLGSLPASAGLVAISEAQRATALSLP